MEESIIPTRPVEGGPVDRLTDLRREIDLVRTEIRELKSCQVQYFMLSVTATAGLLGLGQVRTDWCRRTSSCWRLSS